MNMLFLLLILLLLALLGVAVVLFYRRVARGEGGGRAADTGLPRCGQCGYAAVHVTTFACPECGSDLRQAGILPPGFRGSAGTSNRLAMWTLFMLVGGFILNGLALSTIIPIITTAEEDLTLRQPASGAYERVVIKQNGSSMYLPLADSGVIVPMRAMVSIVMNNGKTHSALIDADNRGHRFLNSGRAASGPFDRVAMNSWIQRMGIDPSHPQVAGEIDVIMGKLNLAQAHGQFPLTPSHPFGSSRSSGSSGGGHPFMSSSGGSSTSNSPAGWATGGFNLLLVFIWGYGVVRIFRGRREGQVAA